MISMLKIRFNLSSIIIFHTNSSLFQSRAPFFALSFTVSFENRNKKRKKIFIIVTTTDDYQYKLIFFLLLSCTSSLPICPYWWIIQRKYDEHDIPSSVFIHVSRMWPFTFFRFCSVLIFLLDLSEWSLFIFYM